MARVTVRECDRCGQWIEGDGGLSMLLPRQEGLLPGWRDLCPVCCVAMLDSHLARMTPGERAVWWAYVDQEQSPGAAPARADGEQE